MDDLSTLRDSCKRIAGLVGSVNHAATMANASPASVAAGDWYTKKRSELHAAEDELAALLATRKAAR